MNAEMSPHEKAINAWVEQYVNMAGSEIEGTLQFSEAKALAGLFVAVGRYDLADLLMETWANLDEELAAEHENELDKLRAEYAEHLPPKCDECDDEATEFWPNLTKPVKLCDDCYHNARRSGWEPGR